MSKLFMSTILQVLAQRVHQQAHFTARHDVTATGDVVAETDNITTRKWETAFNGRYRSYQLEPKDENSRDMAVFWERLKEPLETLCEFSQDDLPNDDNRKPLNGVWFL